MRTASNISPGSAGDSPAARGDSPLALRRHSRTRRQATADEILGREFRKARHAEIEPEKVSFHDLASTESTTSTTVHSHE
jgi:hypothetical protein